MPRISPHNKKHRYMSPEERKDIKAYYLQTGATSTVIATKFNISANTAATIAEEALHEYQAQREDQKRLEGGK